VEVSDLPLCMLLLDARVLASAQALQSIQVSPHPSLCLTLSQPLLLALVVCASCSLSRSLSHAGCGWAVHAQPI
jgi:hypothetical protein